MQKVKKISLSVNVVSSPQSTFLPQIFPSSKSGIVKFKQKLIRIISVPRLESLFAFKHVIF